MKEARGGGARFLAVRSGRSGSDNFVPRSTGSRMGEGIGSRLVASRAGGGPKRVRVRNDELRLCIDLVPVSISSLYRSKLRSCIDPLDRSILGVEPE